METLNKPFNILDVIVEALKLVTILAGRICNVQPARHNDFSGFSVFVTAGVCLWKKKMKTKATWKQYLNNSEKKKTNKHTHTKGLVCILNVVSFETEFTAQKMSELTLIWQIPVNVRNL